jgi:hypothetical protein
MEREGSLLCSCEPATGLGPQEDYSIPHPEILMRCSLILSMRYNKKCV